LNIAKAAKKVNSLNQQHDAPGRLIEALLQSRGWSKRVLAAVLGLDETGLNKAVLGNRNINPKLASALSQVFSVPAERFLRPPLRKPIEVDISCPDPLLAVRSTLFKLPVSEMIRRGWLQGVKDIRKMDEVEAALCRFFAVSSTAEIELFPTAPKKTQLSVPVTPSELAWLYRVKKLAGAIVAAPYSPQGAAEAIQNFPRLLESPGGVQKVPAVLAECGIRFVVVEGLSRTKIEGVGFWLNEQSPVIAMSLRQDRADNFWMVLRTEWDHILRSHGATLVATVDVVLGNDGMYKTTSLDEEERRTTKAVKEFYGHLSLEDPFPGNPASSADDVFPRPANSQSIHRSLIANGPWHQSSISKVQIEHKVKIRSEVLRSVMFDGWGNVAPV
jgi:HTH-type transcriptional regulator/antitoxin HigA